MRVKGITDENFTDYKLPAMFISVKSCTFKCDRESGCRICQNSALAQEPNIMTTADSLIKRYIANPITKAIVIGGLEPFDNLEEVEWFIQHLRRDYECMDPVVIYTGYTEREIKEEKLEVSFEPKFLHSIFQQKNIVIKYGRFIPNQKSHFDEVLGVKLSSDNQYAKEYNFEN